MPPPRVMRPDEQIAMCQGKARFTNPGLAHTVSGRRSKRQRPQQRKIGDVYRCDVCGGWHIGRRSSAK